MTERPAPSAGALPSPRPLLGAHSRLLGTDCSILSWRRFQPPVPREGPHPHAAPPHGPHSTYGRRVDAELSRQEEERLAQHVNVHLS